MNKDSQKPYRMLEKSSDWSTLQHATTHFVKNLNTDFVREVQDNDVSIAKVTRRQSLNFCSINVYCCNIFDLLRILLSFICYLIWEWYITSIQKSTWRASGIIPFFTSFMTFRFFIIHKTKHGFPYVVIWVFKFCYMLSIWQVLLLME